VLLLKWTAFFDVPSRFIQGAFALSVPLGAALLARAGGRGFRTAAAGLLLAAVTVIPAGGLTLRVARAFGEKADPETASNAIHWRNAIQFLAPGSRILVFARGGAADYDLFLPKLGYPNYVVSWGQEEFEAARLASLVREHRITHVVVQDDRELRFMWRPALPTVELVKWLGSRPDFEEVPGVRAPVRVYRTR
jgi:hypothetical protein